MAQALFEPLQSISDIVGHLPTAGAGENAHGEVGLLEVVRTDVIIDAIVCLVQRLRNAQFPEGQLLGPQHGEVLMAL